MSAALERELRRMQGDPILGAALDRLGVRELEDLEALGADGILELLKTVAPAPRRRWVSAADAARALDVPGRTVREWLATGILPGSRPHPRARWRIDVNDLAAFGGELERL